MTNPLPAAELERRATEQRQRLKDSVAELRTNVRGRLNVRNAAHSYLWQASTVAALLSLAVGYTIAGAFTDR